MDPVQFDFSGECVVVTGRGSGIGRATTLAFGEANAVAINADLDPDPRDHRTGRGPLPHRETHDNT